MAVIDPGLFNMTEDKKPHHAPFPCCEHCEPTDPLCAVGYGHHATCEECAPVVEPEQPTHHSACGRDLYPPEGCVCRSWSVTREPGQHKTTKQRGDRSTELPAGRMVRASEVNSNKLRPLADEQRCKTTTVTDGMREWFMKNRLCVDCGSSDLHRAGRCEECYAFAEERPPYSGVPPKDAYHAGQAAERARIERIIEGEWCTCGPDDECMRCHLLAAIRGGDDATRADHYEWLFDYTDRLLSYIGEADDDWAFECYQTWAPYFVKGTTTDDA